MPKVFRFSFFLALVSSSFSIPFYIYSFSLYPFHSGFINCRVFINCAFSSKIFLIFGCYAGITHIMIFCVIWQIEDLQLSLCRMEKEHGRREDILRQEISDLHQVYNTCSFHYQLNIKFCCRSSLPILDLWLGNDLQFFCVSIFFFVNFRRVWCCLVSAFTRGWGT